MERNLSIDAQHGDELLTITLHGELDLATVAQVRDAAAANGAVPVVVDLHDVRFIDSSGMRLLLELNAAPVGFRRPSNSVSRLLELSGTRELLRWHAG